MNEDRCIRSLFRSHQHRKGNQGFRLSLEALEGRRLLSTMDFRNSSGGSWGVAANWVNAANSSDHHLPTSSDNAVTDVPGNVTVAYQRSQPTVHVAER